MVHWPALEAGVRATGARLTVTLSDGTSRTIDVPAEYGPDDVVVTLTHLSQPGLREVAIGVLVRYEPSDPDGPPRSYYRTG